jgi:hypothetical protein
MMARAIVATVASTKAAPVGVRVDRIARAMARVGFRSGAGLVVASRPVAMLWTGRETEGARGVDAPPVPA